EEYRGIRLHCLNETATERPAVEHVGPPAEPDSLPLFEQLVLSSGQSRQAIVVPPCEWCERGQFDLHPDELSTSGRSSLVVEEIGVDKPQGVVVGVLLKGVEEAFFA